jgi:hypothetical protein
MGDLDTNANINLSTGARVQFGNNDNCAIYYNNTDLLINPSNTGTANIHCSGAVLINYDASRLILKDPHESSSLDAKLQFFNNLNSEQSLIGHEDNKDLYIECANDIDLRVLGVDKLTISTASNTSHQDFTVDGQCNVADSLIVSGAIGGYPQSFTYSLNDSGGVADQYMWIGQVQCSNGLGIAMERAGSIVGISAAIQSVGIGTEGTITAEVRLNGVLVFSVTGTVSGGSLQMNATQARGIDTFNANDNLQAYINYGTHTVSNTNSIVAVRVVYDS